MRVAMDMAPVALNSAGERRYITSLVPKLAERPDLEIAPLTMASRLPSSSAQRVAWQAAAEGLYYPLLIGRKARGAGAAVLHHPRHLVPPEIGVTIPSVVTVHDVLALSHPEYFSALIARRFGILARISTRAAARVITGSHYSRRTIAERLRVDEGKIRVTPYAVDARFTPTRRDPELLREALGVQTPYVLCLGTLEPRKNLEGAIRAFERVQDRVPDHSLVVVGARGWKAGPLQALIDATDARVHTTGFVSDDHLPLLYSMADCFLFPSFGEGFGFPVLEAMACGTPVITSANSSLFELAGDAALLVDPSDGDAVSDAIAAVLEDGALREQLSKKGISQAARFSWDICAAETAAVYREVA